MKESIIKDFLGIEEVGNDIELSINTNNKEVNEENKRRIKKLFDIALKNRFIVYFDGRAVEEPYDGLEFSTEEEEFYYNNAKSYIVFQDISGFKVRFKVSALKKYDYADVYKVVEKAVNFTKAHPELSDYKLY